ncbi:hypothetical protein K2W90_05090 [Candidatus Babeliales bacterium]|nr:hypothetical protein [Candidatus Babeliales bacterium]
MIEHIMHNDLLLAIIVRQEYGTPGISFLTPDNFSQQLGYMQHQAGHEIKAHVHNEVKREVVHTKEVLFIRKGVLRADFYHEDGVYAESRLLRAGDVVLLARGGHGFRVIEDVEMFEVKQGPYAGLGDKTIIAKVDEHDLRMT